MLSPRSFLLAHRQGQGQSQRIAAAPASSAGSAPAAAASSNNNNTSSTPSRTCYPIPSETLPSTSPDSYSPNFPLDTISIKTTNQHPIFSPVRWSPKYDEGKTNIAVTITPVSIHPVSDATMGKRKDRRETLSLSPASPPTTTTSLTIKPTTPTSPVKIPTSNGNRHVAHPQKRHSSQRRRTKETLSPENISPSLVALLAVTDIPRPNKLRNRRRRTVKAMTLDEVFDCQDSSCEKELGWSLSRSPLDMLLSPPQDAMDDDDSVSECNIGCGMSTRTYSIDSIPSLDDSFSSDGLSSFDTPKTPSSLRRNKFTPKRMSLEPILSPPGSVDEHPLAGDVDEEELDFAPLPQPEQEAASTKSQFLHPFKPLRSAFKSNLTASLRALRSAAKSFSAINFPSIPADDMLTRSILTIDPNVPYADERRPPVLEDIPSEAMRRYLNPTTNARIESPSKTYRAGTFAASIQMRTYKIQRYRAASPGRNSYPSTSLQPSPEPQQPQVQSPSPSAPGCPPGMRQREMRENSDFIRIAVMEMAMRKRGKLDDQRPGRARWALPPRKMSTKPYEVSADGVPVRWIPMTV